MSRLNKHHINYNIKFSKIKKMKKTSTLFLHLAMMQLFLYETSQSAAVNKELGGWIPEDNFVDTNTVLTKEMCGEDTILANRDLGCM